MTTRLADMAFIFHIWCTEWDLEIEPLRFPPVCFEQLNHTHAAHQARVVHLRTLFSNRWKRTCWCTPFLQESMNRELHGFMQTHYLWSLSPSKRLGELLCCVCMQYAWQVVKSTSSARPNAYQRVMQRAGHLSLAQMNHHCTDLHLDKQGFTL